MNVTFFCAQCGAKLQVEDQWCGKPITCPNCQQIVIVPPPEMTIPVATEATPVETTDIRENPPANPYESPILYQGNMLADISSDMLPVRIKAFELVKNTWRFVFRYWREFCLIGLVFLLLSGFMTGIMYFTVIIPGSSSGPLVNMENSTTTIQTPQIPKAFLVIWLLSALVSFVLSVMVYQYILHVLRTGDHSLKNMIPRSLQSFIRTFICCLLYGLIILGLYIVMVTTIALCAGISVLLPTFFSESLDSFWILIVRIGSYSVAGIIAFAIICAVLKVLIGYSFFTPFVLDRNMGCMESLSHSYKYTKGNILKYIIAVFFTFLPFTFIILILFSVLGYAPNSSGSIVLPILLQLIQNAVVYPLWLALGANMYFQMTNQSHIFRQQVEPIRKY